MVLEAVEEEVIVWAEEVAVNITVERLGTKVPVLVHDPAIRIVLLSGKNFPWLLISNVVTEPPG